MRPQRHAGPCQLAADRMDQQADAALQPGEARVEDQIDEARERGGRHAALVPIHVLLCAGQRRILIRRQGRVRSAVLVPVAVVGMVIVVMLRPHVLRHPRHDAEEKPGRAIEPTAAKQAAVAAFVHQAKDPHGKQDDGQQWDQDEPGRYARRTGRQTTRGALSGTRVVKTCFNPLMSSDLVYRPIMAHFWRLKQSLDTTIDCPPASIRIVIVCTLLAFDSELRHRSMFLDGVPRHSSASGTSALGSVSQSERVVGA